MNKKPDISKVADELLLHRGFRFSLGQEIHRALQKAKLKSRFLNWFDKRLISIMGWVRALDKHL